MNRQERRKTNKKMRIDAAKFLMRVPVDQWPSKPPGLIAAFRSKKFLVQIYEEKDCQRLSVCRSEVKIGGWKENITWEELQGIKRELGFGDKLAVEIYPRDKDIVNVANMRHLWIVDGLSMGWRK